MFVDEKIEIKRSAFKNLKMVKKMFFSEIYGANPSMCVCELCGEPTGELALLGKCNEYRCNCGALSYGRAAGDMRCGKCGSRNLVVVARDVKASRNIAGGICEACREKIERDEALVRQGGIFWKCSKCGARGVVRPGTYCALMVRHKLGIVAPNPCGVELTEKECPVCQGDVR